MAIGDALGAPLEGLSPQQIKAHYGRVRDYVDGVQAWKRKQHRWRMKGLYSDDTQQALCLCEVLLNHRKVDQERLAELYRALLVPKGPFLGAHRGIGRSFRQVLTALERGVPPQDTGQPGAGIGASMRIAPVGLYFWDKPGLLFEAVMAASLITHRDVRSLSGALAVARTVARILAESACEPSLLLRIASDLVQDENLMRARYADVVLNLERHAGSLADAIAHAESVLEMPRGRALAALVDQANRHGSEPRCSRPTMGFPPACIPTCLYLLLSTDGFEEALTEVINLGGDTDTAGAILGAMAGAHYGVDAIPMHWLDGLQNRAGIEARARAMERRSSDELHIPDLITTEQELTRREAEYVQRQAMYARQRSDRGANHVF
jgi:ADP-ribosylglycohydrolase